ncbi:MSMEG_6728 family protein [Geodermatophilus sp. DSM 44513]|uniref:MSMEG_6728 family protein n=1 Tax=Geodermatophilus sp. DSM 44513 TaxID=1528104 RepID=UPI001283F650|nr:MSMEG_6728 family protein [Geodermatophilus sp. DSM 44513]WNV76359.1 MSMEG_6728 family protein [Geodermatophilus sp. DSM 44513]
MQTFLPVPDFTDSARMLDSPRLGKQRVETLQVLRALELPDYGWTSHPVVRMWRGRTPALVAYGLASVRAWQERGFADSTHTLIAEFAPDVVGVGQEELARAGVLPSWVGDEAVHRSHRSNLLAKDPGFYRPLFGPRFGPEPDDLPYVWPEPDDLPPPAPPEGTRVWVVRPRAHNELGACLAAGVVGVGTQSGVDVDATGLSPVELRALAKELSGRRPSKDLRQLSVFLDDIRPGDPVALPIEHGAGLLLGEVLGDYLFQGRELLPHRRPARWDRVVPRAAARPPATLQDPRALFSVVIDPDVLPPSLAGVTYREPALPLV